MRGQAYHLQFNELISAAELWQQCCREQSLTALRAQQPERCKFSSWLASTKTCVSSQADICRPAAQDGQPSKGLTACTASHRSRASQAQGCSSQPSTDLAASTLVQGLMGRRSHQVAQDWPES